MEIYTVKEGDTVYSIAKTLGIGTERLIRDNGIEDTQYLKEGKALVILRPLTVKSIKTGTDLLEIALNNNTTLNMLYRNNPRLAGKLKAESDDIITLKYNTEKLGKLSTNACAYPDIDKNVLTMTLSYLTYLTVMGARVSEAGEMITGDDSETVELARYYGTSPIMHISIINDENVGARLIGDIENTLISKRYDGVNIYFGDLNARKIDFCKKLKEVCNSRGKVLFLTSKSDMTNNVSVDYSDGITLLPSDSLGFSRDNFVNITANMYLPIRGSCVDFILNANGDLTDPTVLSYTASNLLVNDTDSQIMYDESYNYSYFEYTDKAGNQHKALTDDPKSIYWALKRACIQSWSGITVWNIEKFCPYLWSVINTNVDIVRTGDND